MGMVVGEFLFLVTKSRRLNLLSNYEICLQNFSFSSRNRRNNFWISPSLLHTREIIADFSQFVCKNSHPLLEPEDRSQDFSQRTPSFSSQYDFLGFSQFAPEGVCASKVDQKATNQAFLALVGSHWTSV